MIRFIRPSLVLVLGLLGLVPGLQAQVPSTSDAQRLLQTRPELGAQLRARIEGSGLSPAQVRARLQAEGYPASLLDAYLGTAGADADAIPGDNVFAAVRALGIVDSLAVDSLLAGTARRARQAPRDTVLQRWADSLGVGIDSIDLVADTLTRDVRLRLERWRVAQNRYDTRQIRADSGFTLFGREVFDQESSRFDPNLAGPVDANYRLGPGDRLVLILTGDVEAAYTLDVTREGFVVIPQVGQIPVANLTMAQLEDVLYSRLGRVYSGVGRGPGARTRFSVSMARLRSNQVYVVGDVEMPGSYRISSAGTVMTALYAAGGPTVNGNMRAVQVRRGGRTIGTLDVYDYLLEGNSANDLRLQTGDVVFVPPRGARVRVFGQVVRPATYEIEPEETLEDLIRAAGGFTPQADRRRIQIERILAPEDRQSAGTDRVVMEVQPGEQGGIPEVDLKGGDVVRVFAVAERVANRVTVKGNVWSPGQVGFTPGMRLSDALRLAGGLQPDAYLGQVLVARLQPDSTRTQLRAALADTTGRAIQDMLLADGDEIRVFSQTEFRPRRYVVINGAVRHGGRIPYREGMTLRDAVLLAGGLEEGALLTEAEVARMPENRATGATAQTVRVALDSSYLFERDADGRYMGPPGVPAPADGGPEVALEPYDNVLIFRQPGWSLPRTVALTGEVRRPGRYTLRDKTERLTDLIERAGGLTPEAYAAGVLFMRADRGLGRIGVDLPSALEDPGHRDNLILLDGDSINIPLFSAVVNVRGAVNSPVAVAYVPGRDLEYYINSAGGPNRRGDAEHAFVTQPNGKVESRRSRGWLPDYLPEPQPGSQVYVPELDPTDKRDTLQLLSVGAQVVGSLVALAAIITRF